MARRVFFSFHFERDIFRANQVLLPHRQARLSKLVGLLRMNLFTHRDLLVLGPSSRSGPTRGDGPGRSRAHAGSRARHIVWSSVAKARPAKETGRWI